MEQFNLIPNNDNAGSPETNFWLAIKRNWATASIVGLGIFSILAVKVFQETPKYKSESLILVANQNAVPVFNSDDATSNQDQDRKLSTDIEILKSPNLLAKALTKLKDEQQELTASDVALNLSIIQSKDVNVLMVSYIDTKAERARAVLEALVSTYIEYGRDSRRSPLKNSIRFIEEKLPEARAQLNKSSDALIAFRKKYNTDSPDSDAALAYKNKENLQQQADQAEMALNLAKQQYQQARAELIKIGQNPDTSLSDSILSQDTTYQYLVEQLKAVNVQLAVEEIRYQPDNPVIQDLKEKQRKLSKLLNDQAKKVSGNKIPPGGKKGLVSGAIQQNLANQLVASKLEVENRTIQLKDIRNLQTQAAYEFQRSVQLHQQHRELERQYQLNSKAVDNFLAKLQELKIREAQEVLSWKIVEAPYLPTVPISPNIKRSLIQNAIASILLSIGLAYLLEKTDQRVKDVEEIKKMISSPVLGNIPKVNEQKLEDYRILDLPQMSGFFAEAIGASALALLFKNKSEKSNRRRKCLVITSSVAGEGKTTITCNLGVALAELGQRVLIVDGAFASPCIHKVFGLPNQTGLTTVLTTDAPWQSLIHSGQPKKVEIAHQATSSEISGTCLTKNLPNYEPDFTDSSLVRRSPDVLTSGMINPQSIYWLFTTKMIDLLAQWEQNYDYILIDTSAINTTTTQSLISRVDGVLFVVGIKCLTYSMLQNAMKTAKELEAKLLGLLVNKIL